MNTISPQIQRLLDKQEIYELVCTYCRAVDRLDRDLMRSCYHDDATEKRGFFDGTADAFCDFVVETLHGIASTQHFIGNALIDVDGDTAYGEIYLTAQHRLVVDGTEKDLFVGGRYIDRYERRQGVWKIAFRTERHDWTRTEDACEDWTRANPAALLGERGPQDLVFRRDLLRKMK
ncbi:nuclear transport factor 2 family protein [Noviherbaspirillum sedimenti]|uniref:Nuclear transport factor 2 family protein n=1 Tax=Noviherbaspirillum sedimenti TaxID=2320865 RepID=A0A3A3G9B8_9BURK|nr:nuclear transport factor 2 family protein [Noviherbaspirillum sedimenti]RJG03172.1 nuclear transport factor 2 family protein [Noviherbaspirillum sedimenti]